MTNVEGGASAEVTGVILAGGLARRMGRRDKGLIPLGGRPILAHIVARLAAQVDQLVLNANGDLSRFAGLGVPVTPDPIGGFLGPMAGVLAGLVWTRQNTDALRIVTVPGDTPFFPNNLVTKLESGRLGSSSIAVAGSRGRTHPVVGIWPVRLADELMQWLGDANHRAVRDFLATQNVAVVDFPDEGSIDPFFNINTKEDLEVAERYWGQLHT